MLVKKYLSLPDRLLVKGDLDGLPSSLLASPELLCHFHQTNLCFSSLCT